MSDPDEKHLCSRCANLVRSSIPDCAFCLEGLPLDEDGSLDWCKGFQEA
jgi:hypothetical protein